MMRYGTIAGLDKRVSRIAQGTVMVDGEDLDRDFALLDGVFERGCTMFDTAHVYGRGANERAVGRWVNSRGVRDQVVIIAKGAHHSGDRRRVTPEDITADLTESLDRFGFDYVDMYLLHRDDPLVPVGPIVEVLDSHAGAGRIRAFGGSNWTHHRIAEANEYAESRGLMKFVASSPQFSLAVPTRPVWGGCTSMSGPAGADERRWYQEHDIAVICWSSLALGFMAGAVGRNRTARLRRRFSRMPVKAFFSDDNLRRLKRAEALAAEMGVPVAQIALAYIFNRPLNVFALVGCKSVEQFQADLGALEIQLSAEQMAWLELGGE